MSLKPISPLRARMIQDMTVRNFVEKTKNDYIRCVKSFAAFLGRSPDQATPEDLRAFQVHQTETGVRPPTINGSVAALRFFFATTLGRADMSRHLTFVREPRKIPVILDPDEVARLIEAAPGPKYKAMFAAAYGAGLRVSEVVALKVPDIDSQRMLIRIEQGKGRKDRYAMLSPQLLELLRDWYRIARPKLWLFSGFDPMLPLTTRQFTRAVHAAAERAQIKKRVTPHTLRHSFATHLLEAKIDVRIIQVLFETSTYCPPTANRGSDLVSVPSAMWRDGARFQAIRLPWRRSRRDSAARWLDRLHSGMDDQGACLALRADARAALFA